jgi:hypothetical protein
MISCLFQSRPARHGAIGEVNTRRPSQLRKIVRMQAIVEFVCEVSYMAQRLGGLPVADLQTEDRTSILMRAANVVMGRLAMCWVWVTSGDYFRLLSIAMGLLAALEDAGEELCREREEGDELRERLAETSSRLINVRNDLTDARAALDGARTDLAETEDELAQLRSSGSGAEEKRLALELAATKAELKRTRAELKRTKVTLQMTLLDTNCLVDDLVRAQARIVAVSEELKQATASEPVVVVRPLALRAGKRSASV